MGSIMDLFFRIGVDSSELDRALTDASKKASSFGSAFKSGVGTVLGVGAKAVGVATAAVGAFAGTSVKAGSDFDAAMSQVGATMLKTSEEMKAEVGEVDTAYGHFSGNLRDFAQFLGKETVFSATQAAEALNYMALAGYDTQESMDMLPNVLSLAAAGGFDLARASDMVTDAQSAFGISAERTAQMVDEMAKAASTGNTSVEQLGDAFLVVGGLAKELNGGFVELADGTKAPVDGIQEMEIAMTAMANAGIKGSEAGTHMRNMIMKLSKPTSDGTVLLEKMGVKVFDTSGQMRSLADIMGDLNGALGTMTQEEKINAIGELFNARDLASAEALLGAVGEDWNKIGESILNADGAAADMAALQLDNLQGDVKLFKSALEGAQIVVSDQLTPSLRKFVQFGTDGLSTMTDAFKEGGLSGAMSAFGKILSEGITMITGMMPDFINAGMSLLGALGQGIIDNLPQLVDAATQIVVQLASGLVEALPSLVEAAFTIITTLTETLLEQAPVLAEAGLNALTSLTEGMDPLVVIEKIGEILTSLVDAIIEWIPALLDQGIAMVDEMSAGLSENGPAAIEAIGAILGDLITKIIDNLPEFLAKGIELISHIAQGIIDNLPEILSAMAGVLADLIAKIAESLPDFLAKGIELLGEVGAGILRAVPDLLGEIPGIFSDVVGKFASQDWASIGKNIIEGVKSGISSAASKIAEAAKDAARKALDAAKNFLGIHSPSRVFREQIGKNISLGLASGIENYADEVEDAAEALAESATDPFGAFDEVSKYVIPDMPETAVLGTSNGAQGMSESVLNEKLGRIIDLLQNIDLSGAGVYIDGRTLVGELVPAMDLAMGREASYKGRGVI